MSDLSTVTEVQSLWRTLTAAEQAQVTTLLPVVSDLLRQEAQNVGKDLDLMIASGEVYPTVVASVVTDVIRRYINSIADDSAPRTQYSESALGYSVSGTFLVAGGGMYIKEKELARLGLKRQRFGGIDLAGNNSNSL